MDNLLERHLDRIDHFGMQFLPTLEVFDILSNGGVVIVTKPGTFFPRVVKIGNPPIARYADTSNMQGHSIKLRRHAWSFHFCGDEMMDLAYGAFLLQLAGVGSREEVRTVLRNTQLPEALDLFDEILTMTIDHSL